MSTPLASVFSEYVKPKDFVYRSTEYITDEPDRPILFFAGGQSNWHGQNAGVYSGPVPDTCRTWNTTTKAFEPIVLGNSAPGNFRPTNAPTLHMMLELERQIPGIKIYTVEVGAVGTSFDLNGDFIPGDGRWSRGNDLREQMITDVSDSIAWLKENEPDFLVGGAIWNQGEREASAIERTLYYEFETRSLISDLQAFLGPDAAIVMNLLNENYVNSASFAPTVETVNAIREAQRKIGDYVFDQNGFEMAADNVHYTAAGYTAIGIGLANLVKTIPLSSIVSREKSGQIGRAVLAAEKAEDAAAVIFPNVRITDTYTAIGENSIPSTTTAERNTAVGEEALSSSTSGWDNVAVGFRALASCEDSIQNVGIGTFALEAAVDTTCQYNFGLGLNALRALTTGSSNVFVGRNSGRNLTDCSNTVSIGESSFLTSTNVANSLALGFGAGRGYNGTGSVFLGYDAGRFIFPSTNEQLVLSNSASDALIYGRFDTKNLALGAATSNFGDGEGMLLLREAPTPPAANPNVNDVLLYVEGGRLKLRQSDGTVGFISISST